MKRKIITMIGIAAVMGAVSIFAADAWIKNAADARARALADNAPKGAGPAVDFNKIVVAKQPLRFGMPLDAAQLSEIPWPQEALPQGAFASIEGLLAEGSRVVLSPIEPNEPVLLAKLSGPNGRATLSNLLTPGMRAVTVQTDEIAGVGGFITPGDRVDVVLTRDAGAIQEVEGNAHGAAGSTITSEVVVENVKVLSVGQGADERQTTPQIADSLTIEVTTDGAQKIALARKVGSLSLTLRSSAETEALESGITTISAFGGSVASSAVEKVSEMFTSSTGEPEGPKHTTVIVTRALQSQPYQVIVPAKAEAKKAAGAAE
ncbi:Flp pilus assembly protein CpaB [Arvimicrobium flavum]|uniref:Flp pilus assembly protein CpaB n=1 Tax=Arvimicrobium flavum TaxID=3393320 RepID=UPI00237BA488|nr:Flp pilus assembly protein CpaB [Mesorhizobium shangrilense]